MVTLVLEDGIPAGRIIIAIDPDRLKLKKTANLLPVTTAVMEALSYLFL
jgi:hypothetical protein